MPTNYQHESPVIPGNWNDEERRYARRVDELFEQLFASLGASRQRVAALEKELKEAQKPKKAICGLVLCGASPVGGE